MQYITQCVSFNALSYDDLSPLWEYCRLPEKRAVILCPMLNGVSSVYLAENALESCRIVIFKKFLNCTLINFRLPDQIVLLAKKL